MAIRLPHDAHGFDYEDQICALLLAHGYYLDTRLILKKGAEEVLEFDAIATPVNNYQERRVVEVKSGKWGIGDIFKLYGQVMYTEEVGAWLIHKEPALERKRIAISEITQNVPVSVINVNLNAETGSLEVPKGLDISEDVAKIIFSTSWWSRSADRIAQSRFRNWRKSQDDAPEIIKRAQYYLTMMGESLFKRKPIFRVDALYDAYKQAPQLTSSLIAHVAETSGESIREVRRSVSNDNGRPHLQYVMAQEYRSRVAIVKNAYDALLQEAKSLRADGNVFDWEQVTKELLPNSFKAGMKALGDFSFPEHVPYFYQVFVEVFGGFYIPEDPREIENISMATGIPPEMVPTALELLDAFFPISKGWIHKGDRVHLLKAVPAYLRGAGCFCRRDLYGDEWSKEFPQLKVQIPNWHNALYRLLEPSLSE